MHISVVYILAFLGSYLIGSIPFSWIITRIKTGEDLRKIGSGNVGGRNVYRATKSKLWALFAGILDVTRTVTGMAIPYFLILEYYFIDSVSIERISAWPYDFVSCFVLTITGIGAILGHNWPIYLLSHGGRGITVVIGSMALANPILLGFWILLWPIVIIFVGYSSITYIVVTILVGVIALFLPTVMLMPWAQCNLGLALLLFGIAIIMLSRQGDNIRKIKAGEAKKMQILKALRGKEKLSDEILK